METWKPIQSYGGKYEVSDLGKVRMAATKQVLKPFNDPLQEYDRVMLYFGGKRRKVLVHTLVADAFLGIKPIGMEIDHLNTNIHDNRAVNLKYVTRSENRMNPLTVFNREVARIKRAIASGKKSQEDILRLVRVLKAMR